MSTQTNRAVPLGVRANVIQALRMLIEDRAALSAPWEQLARRLSVRFARGVAEALPTIGSGPAAMADPAVVTLRELLGALGMPGSAASPALDATWARAEALIDQK